MAGAVAAPVTPPISSTAAAVLYTPGNGAPEPKKQWEVLKEVEERTAAVKIRQAAYKALLAEVWSEQAEVQRLQTELSTQQRLLNMRREAYRLKLSDAIKPEQAAVKTEWAEILVLKTKMHAATRRRRTYLPAR